MTKSLKLYGFFNLLIIMEEYLFLHLKRKKSKILIMD